jgi:hypothetical protein
MKKPKKITVKFFLNTNLHYIDKSDGKYYPLYAQITYDRKNTQIKCNYGNYYRGLDQVKADTPNLLGFEERIFKKCVNYELSRQGEDFRLKGLGKIYENHCLSIHSLFSSYLKLRFKNILRQAQPASFLEVLNLEKTGTDFFTIYEASLRLFDNIQSLIADDFKEEMDIYKLYYQLYEEAVQNEQKYQFPVVVDWLEGGHQRDLENKLRENHPHLITKTSILINKIITTKLELV